MWHLTCLLRETKSTALLCALTCVYGATLMSLNSNVCQLIFSLVSKPEPSIDDGTLCAASYGACVWKGGCCCCCWRGWLSLFNHPRQKLLTFADAALHSFQGAFIVFCACHVEFEASHVRRIFLELSTLIWQTNKIFFFVSATVIKRAQFTCFLTFVLKLFPFNPSSRD